MHQVNRFFARLPHAVVTAPTPHDANGKLDQLLREFQEQKEALSYVRDQCDQVMSLTDIVTRYIKCTVMNMIIPTAVPCPFY